VHLRPTKPSDALDSSDTFHHPEFRASLSVRSEKRPTTVENDLISTMHCALHTEVTLAFPVSEVWAVFKDMRRWYAEYTFEVISGPPYEVGAGLQEGHVIKVISSKGLPRALNSGDALGPQHYISKTIKVVPQKEIVNVLSGRAFDWKRYTFFYIYKMVAHAKKTTISVDQYAEAELVQSLTQAEFADYYDQLTRNWHRSWSEAFVNLEKVLAADRAGTACVGH
jgi:hypothetical protein